MSNIFKRVAVGVCVAVVLMLLNNYAFAQAGLQGPFVPIGPEYSSSGPTTGTTNFLYSATDTNGQTVYAAADLNHTEAGVAAQVGARANAANGSSIGAAAEAAGYSLSPPSAIVGGGTAQSDDYALAGLGTCRHTNPADSSPEANKDVMYCAAQLKAHAEASWPGSWIGPECWNGVFGIKFVIDIGGAEYTAGSLEQIWTVGELSDVCPNDGDPLGDPGSPDSPLSDSDYFDFAANGSPPIINNNNFYYNSTNNSVDISYSNHTTNINNLTTAYDTATSTTAGAGLPAGYSYTPTSTQGGAGEGGGGGDENESSDTDFCLEFPNRAGCLDASIGSIPDAEALSETEIALTYTPVAISGIDSCPAPVSMNLGGTTMEFENDYFCDALTTIEPIVLTLFSLAGLYIIIGFRRNS